jgi:hypothetical protein
VLAIVGDVSVKDMMTPHKYCNSGHITTYTVPYLGGHVVGCREVRGTRTHDGMCERVAGMAFNGVSEG